MSIPREVSSLPIFPSTNAPFFDPDTWRLHIGGLVNREQNLTLSDMMNLPSVRIQDDFTCLEGWTVKGIVWRGVRVSELLSLVSMKQNAKCVLFSSGDYAQGLTIERCMTPTTLLAYELNNAPLSFENGAPLRLISKNQECFESVKWVNAIHVVDQLIQGSAKNIALERIQTPPDWTVDIRISKLLIRLCNDGFKVRFNSLNGEVILCKSCKENTMKDVGVTSFRLDGQGPHLEVRVFWCENSACGQTIFKHGKMLKTWRRNSP